MMKEVLLGLMRIQGFIDEKPHFWLHSTSTETSSKSFNNKTLIISGGYQPKLCSNHINQPDIAQIKNINRK